MPAPLGSQSIFGAFDLNVKDPNSLTRDTKSLSFLPGIGNKKLHTMMEVEEAMRHFSDHQKMLVRVGPCGAAWIQRVYKENAGAASPISPLHSISVKRTLMVYTGHCLNTGDGEGGGSGGLYHLCYGMATMTGVGAWMAGCAKEELRNNSSMCNEPLSSFVGQVASFVRHFVPASGLSKAKLYKCGIPAESEDWSDWNSMDH